MMVGDGFNRRRFARNLVAGAAAAGLAPTGSSAAEQSPAPADSLLAVLKHRFPDRLSDEQWQEVRSKLDAQLQTSLALSQSQLQNSDEPAVVFTPWIGP
jgi:hypothetical protein